MFFFLCFQLDLGILQRCVRISPHSVGDFFCFIWHVQKLPLHYLQAAIRGCGCEAVQAGCFSCWRCCWCSPGRQTGERESKRDLAHKRRKLEKLGMFSVREAQGSLRQAQQICFFRGGHALSNPPARWLAPQCSRVLRGSLCQICLREIKHLRMHY